MKATLHFTYNNWCYFFFSKETRPW